MTAHRATPTPSPSADAAARLAAERDLVTARIAQMEGDMAGLVAASHGSNADDEHDPDGTTAYERAQLTSLAGSAQQRLAEIDRALACIDDPSFGSCQSCGEPIGLARLEALPGTPRCVRCAAATPGALSSIQSSH